MDHKFSYQCPCCFRRFTVERSGPKPTPREIDRMVCEECRAAARKTREALKIDSAGIIRTGDYHVNIPR